MFAIKCAISQQAFIDHSGLLETHSLRCISPHNIRIDWNFTAINILSIWNKNNEALSRRHLCQRDSRSKLNDDDKLIYVCWGLPMTFQGTKIHSRTMYALIATGNNWVTLNWPLRCFNTGHVIYHTWFMFRWRVC